MKSPDSIKGLLSLLIVIAEDGNKPRRGEGKLTEEESLLLGGLLAEIQNSLGEMEHVLNKFNLSYNG